MDARALQRASLGELLDEIDATFLEAGVSKQVAHLRCTSITAEARRLRARVAELEALMRADKPLPDPGAGTPEPHP